MVLPYINMNPPQVYTCSPSWTHLPPPFHTIPLGHPSAPAPSVQYRASNLDWRLVSYMILYMFQCHSPKLSHPLPLPESKRLFYTSVSLLLSRIQGYCYHLSKSNKSYLNIGLSERYLSSRSERRWLLSNWPESDSKRDNARFHHAAQKQLCDLKPRQFISDISHLIFSNHSWPWVAEIAENKTATREDYCTCDSHPHPHPHFCWKLLGYSFVFTNITVMNWCGCIFIYCDGLNWAFVSRNACPSHLENIFEYVFN